MDMFDPIKVIHCCAPNDRNGNPQRCYVLIDCFGYKRAAWDEGYSGHHAVHPDYRNLAAIAERETVTVREYRSLLKSYPTYPF